MLNIIEITYTVGKFLNEIQYLHINNIILNLIY